MRWFRRPPIVPERWFPRSDLLRESPTFRMRYRWKNPGVRRARMRECEAVGSAVPSCRPDLRPVRDELCKLPEVLGGCGEVELVSSSVRASEAEPVELQEALSHLRLAIGSHDAPLTICSSPLPARDHPARRLAVSQVHAQLPRRRRPTRRARVRRVLRDDLALGAEIWADLRAGTPAPTHAPEFDVAPRRDGGPDRRRAVLALSRRRPRRRGSRHAGAAPARWAPS